MNVEQLLSEKGRRVATIADTESVERAINEMAAQQTSALIVTAGGQPVGLFAERDVLRCHLKYPEQPFSAICLRDAMTRKLIVAEAGEEIRMAMAMMIKADIRHLPVVKQEQVVGMLTISDLVEHQVQALEADLHYLQEYISDLQDAKED